MMDVIFRKLLILNQFFDFYFLNIDISLGNDEILHSWSPDAYGGKLVSKLLFRA